MCGYMVTGLTHLTELASKHAKARAPHTSHGSASEWQRQESGKEGGVDQWEGDLLILAVGNAQQAGMAWTQLPSFSMNDVASQA